MGVDGPIASHLPKHENTSTHTHAKIGTYIHVPSGIRAHDPSAEAFEVIIHVRPLGSGIC